MDDVTSVEDGVDLVILTLGIPVGPEMVLGPINLFSEAARILVSAIDGTGVTRLTCRAVFGSGDSRSSVSSVQGIVFRIFLGHAYDDRTVQEDLIRSSGLQWIIARLVILTNEPKSAKYRVLDNSRDWRHSLVLWADAADFPVAEIKDNT